VWRDRYTVHASAPVPSRSAPECIGRLCPGAYFQIWCHRGTPQGCNCLGHEGRDGLVALRPTADLVGERPADIAGVGRGVSPSGGASPGLDTMPGQDAFGAIQEIVGRDRPAKAHSMLSKDKPRGILEADPNKHQRPARTPRRYERGHTQGRRKRTQARHRHRGCGHRRRQRTLDAIKRVVPPPARELTKSGWSATTEDQPNGVKFTVTSTDPQSPQDQGSRVHGHHGAGWPPPAPSPGHG
jgi:hypothetical protein